MKTCVVICLLIAFASAAPAQFRSQLDQQNNASQSLVHPVPSISSFFGLLNPEHFMMRHNFSLSYVTAGSSGMSLASYTNSMFYKIADPLNIRFDVTLQGSPFGQYGTFAQSDASRLFISNAELHYRPTENTFVKLQYRQLPYGYYNGYYNPFYSMPQWGDE